MQIANIAIQFSYFDFVVTSDQLAGGSLAGVGLAGASCGTCQTDARKYENRASHSPFTSALAEMRIQLDQPFFTHEMHYNAYKVEERLHCHDLQKSTEKCLRKHKTPLTQAAMHTW